MSTVYLPRRARHAPDGIYAQCGVDSCRQVWLVVVLPMEMRKAAKLAKRGAYCPRCGEEKKVFVADAPAMERYRAQILELAKALA